MKRPPKDGKISKRKSPQSRSVPTYQIDNDLMHKDHIKRLSVDFEHQDAEWINELASRSLNTISDVLSHLESDIEESIRDNIICNQEISYADNSVDLFHEEFSNIGGSTTERIGETINLAESSKIFSKYLTFLACIYNNHAKNKNVWNHLHLLFTKNRNEAMHRLLMCKKSLSRKSGTTLAQFIVDHCTGKSGKRNYPADLESTFQRTFDLKRDYTMHHLSVRVMNSGDVKTDIKKLRVYLAWRDQLNMEPKKITAENALLFLALVYTHQTPKAKHVAIDTIDNLMKDCGVDIGYRVEKTVPNMITHLQRHTLEPFKKLVSIFGDKLGWALMTKAKNIKIVFTPDTYDVTTTTLFKEHLGPK